MPRTRRLPPQDPLSSLPGAEFAQYLKATPPAQGFTEVLYPGEIEFNRERDRRKNGIPVEDATWKKLQELAQGYGLTDKLGL